MAVAGVAETRDDEGGLVETFVQRCGVDGEIEAALAQQLDTFRRREHAHDDDGSGSAALHQEVAGVRERAAGCQHRVEHDDLAAGERLGQLVDVRLGLMRFLVAGHADEADVGIRQQLLRGVQETETGTQYRYNHRLVGQLATEGLRQWRLYPHGMCGQTPGRFGQQQSADALELLAEQRVRRVLVAHSGERICDQRVVNDMKSDSHATSVPDRSAADHHAFAPTA